MSEQSRISLVGSGPANRQGALARLRIRFRLLLGPSVLLLGSSLALAWNGLAPAGKIKTRGAPLFSALSPDGNRLYITCYASSDVVVYDRALNHAKTYFFGGHEPMGIAVTPDGAKLFVTNRNGLVKVIDANTHAILDDIKVGGVASNITMSPGGLLAFVTNYGRGKIGRVDFLDTSSHRILGQVEIGVRPLVAAVSPLGDQLFVACAGSNDVYVINISTRKVVKQIPVGLGPDGMAFSRDGATLYVANSGTNDLSLIDVLDLRETRRAPVGNKPFSLVVDKEGRLYVVETGDKAVSIYTPEVRRVGTVPAGKRPTDIQLSKDQKFAFVTDEKANRLLLFKLN